MAEVRVVGCYFPTLQGSLAWMGSTTVAWKEEGGRGTPQETFHFKVDRVAENKSRRFKMLNMGLSDVTLKLPRY